MATIFSAKTKRGRENTQVLVMVIVFIILLIVAFSFFADNRQQPSMMSWGTSAVSGRAMNTMMDRGESMMDSASPMMAPVAMGGGAPALVARQVIQRGTLTLIVEQAEGAASQARMIAESLGGYLEQSSIVSTPSGRKSAIVTLRVPKERFQDALSGLKAMATDVTEESVSNEDVTGPVVDIEARLRNARAEEAQYVAIMKDAVKVEDTLSVAARLADVRGRIEQLEGQLSYYTEHVAFASITATLTAVNDARVAGVAWRPLAIAKTALHQLLVELAAFGTALIYFVVRLPILLLKLALLLLVVYLVVIFGLWVKRRILLL